MSTSRPSNGAAGRGVYDAEPKTKKQRLAAGNAASSQGGPESEEDLYQKAVALVFGGELYSKLLGHGGREAIFHFRGDPTWRKAMDQLSSDELKSLKLPVVRQPNDAELFLLRDILTKPLEAPSALSNTKLGWTLSDTGRKALAASPMASNKLLQNLVRSCCGTLGTIARRKDVAPSVIDEFIASDCPPSVFYSVASNPASSGEVLSAILLRLPKSSLPQYLVSNTLASIGGHCNANRFDLQFLSRHEDSCVRNEVASNPKAVTLGLIQDLSTDTSDYVRMGCAKNRSAPQSILAKLSTDKSTRVRQAVASNPSSGKPLLAMMASSGSERNDHVLWHLAENCKEFVDDVFSMSNATHREVLARYSKQPNTLMELVEMDNGDCNVELALNEKAPADVLASLAMSDNEDVRRNVAGNENITLPTIELLIQNDDLKRMIAQNPSTPLNILEALATDEDSNVRMGVMGNSAAPEDLLVKMLTDPANTDLDLEELYSNKNLSLTCLVGVMDKQLERDGDLSGDLREVVCDYDQFGDRKDALPRGTAVALSKCDDAHLREFSAAIPSLPVVDILRLVEDPDLDSVSGYLADNPLLQVAVEKLSQLLSKDMVGSNLHFDDGEQWW